MHKISQSKTGPRKAVIYCRVSSLAQLRKGDGLGSQETRCREFARFKSYEVEAVFHDNRSGGVADRPGLSALLAHLKLHKDEGRIVIIDDLNRFSRDVVVHWQLRALIAEAGGTLESPSIEFGEDSDSILVENLLASVSQHQRQKNGEQTKNRMRARAMNGYWVFHAPTGYRYQKVSGHGNLLVRDEPLASIIAEALEGFASGRFDSQAAVKRFLESQPAFPCKARDGSVRYEEVIRVLTRPHYAGYIEVPNWGVSLRKGHHEGLISFETYDKIQKRLKGGARAPANSNIEEDFPLRGYVACAHCGGPLTACWSRSKTGAKHPYYMCFSKGCAVYRKSTRRQVLEDQFEGLLSQLAPSADVHATFKTLFQRAWEEGLDRIEETTAALRADLTKTERQIDQMLDRIAEAASDTAVLAYERRITQLERSKLLLTEKLHTHARPRRSFEDQFELVFKFLENPGKLWLSDRLEHKRAVLKLSFAKRLTYCRNGGFRTPQTTLPFKVLADLQARKCGMAGDIAFELTPHSGRWRSVSHTSTVRACKSSPMEKGGGAMSGATAPSLILTAVSMSISASRRPRIPCRSRG